jgi:hypothetical protein
MAAAKWRHAALGSDVREWRLMGKRSGVVATVWRELVGAAAGSTFYSSSG